MIDGMESRQGLWHNRRVQRSGLFAFFVLTFIVIGLHSRRDWPAVADLNNPLSSGRTLPILPFSHADPIRDSKKSEFDLNDTPRLPLATQKGIETQEFTSESPPGEATNAKANTENSVQYLNPALDPTRVAMIIETRKLSHLPALLQSFIGILPPQWVVRMIGTDEAFENIRESLPLMRAVKSGKLVLTYLPEEYPVAGQEQISATLTNLTFYRDFLAPAEWLLIFQADTVLCSASDQSLDDWVDLGYPWVGAPWNHDAPGGNGGLSLRHVPRIISILEKESRKPGDPFWEDRWLCDRIPDSGLPPLTKYFSVESVWYDRPLGYHLRGSGKMLDLTIWGNPMRKRHIFRYCPETKLILGNMKLEDKDDEMKEAEENRRIANKANGGNGTDPAFNPKPVAQPAKNSTTTGFSSPLTAVDRMPRKPTMELIREDWPAIQRMQLKIAEKQRAVDALGNKWREDVARAKLLGLTPPPPPILEQEPEPIKKTRKKKPKQGEKKANGEEAKAEGEEKKTDEGENKAEGEEAKAEGEEKPDGEDKKPDEGEKKPDEAEKKSAGGDKKQVGLPPKEIKLMSLFDMSKDRQKLKYTYELPEEVVDEGYIHTTLPVPVPRLV